MTLVVGIVGGVGPLASAHFYERLLRLSGAVSDQTYPPAVLVAEQVPSRIAHLTGVGPSPLPALLSTVRRLHQAGAEVIAIPSATTHAYYDRIVASVRVPVCDLLAETGISLRQRGSRRPMFLATAATTALRLFEPHVAPGTVAQYPDPAGQRAVNEFIDAVKRGEPVEPLRTRFTQWIEAELCAEGPDSVVLACTELSVIAPHTAPQLPVVDISDVLARSVLRLMGDPGREDSDDTAGQPGPLVGRGQR